MGIFSKRRRKKSALGSNSLLRWLGPSSTVAGLLYGVYLLLTGGLSFSSLDSILGTSPETSFHGEAVSLGDRAQRPAGRIRIATFNIEQFADEKSRTRVNEHGVDVLGTIAKIIGKFDVVAIQEVQDADGVALQRLVALLNESGKETGVQYAATMSEPIGEEQLESYAFVWDRSTVRLVPESAYVVSDDGGRMYREPMVATFQTVVAPESTRPPFRFTLINVQTKPDRVDPAAPDSEINVLADVFRSVRDFEFKQFREDDFILLGNLNVSTDRLGQLTQIKGVTSIAEDIQTNFGRKRTNDHILIDRTVTGEYAGSHGVIDFVADLGLTREQADAISDHLPLWAEFEAYEREPVTASRPPTSGPRTRLIE